MPNAILHFWIKYAIWMHKNGRQTLDQYIFFFQQLIRRAFFCWFYSQTTSLRFDCILFDFIGECLWSTSEMHSVSTVNKQNVACKCCCAYEKLQNSNSKLIEEIDRIYRMEIDFRLKKQCVVAYRINGYHLNEENWTNSYS